MSDEKDILESLTSPIIKSLDKQGINLDSLAKKLAEKLEAKETKIFAYQGKIGDEVDLEAHDIQLRAIDMALKLRGDYPTEKHEVSGSIVVDTGIKRDD